MEKLTWAFLQFQKGVSKTSTKCFIQIYPIRNLSFKNAEVSNILLKCISEKFSNFSKISFRILQQFLHYVPSISSSFLAISPKFLEIELPIFPAVIF